jgi:hypothetical protein
MMTQVQIVEKVELQGSLMLDSTKKVVYIQYTIQCGTVPLSNFISFVKPSEICNSPVPSSAV